MSSEEEDNGDDSTMPGNETESDDEVVVKRQGLISTAPLTTVAHKRGPASRQTDDDEDDEDGDGDENEDNDNEAGVPGDTAAADVGNAESGDSDDDDATSGIDEEDQKERVRDRNRLAALTRAKEKKRLAAGATVARKRLLPKAKDEDDEEDEEENAKQPALDDNKTDFDVEVEDFAYDQGDSDQEEDEDESDAEKAPTKGKTRRIGGRLAVVSDPSDRSIVPTASDSEDEEDDVPDQMGVNSDDEEEDDDDEEDDEDDVEEEEDEEEEEVQVEVDNVNDEETKESVHASHGRLDRPTTATQFPVTRTPASHQKRKALTVLPTLSKSQSSMTMSSDASPSVVKKQKVQPTVVTHPPARGTSSLWLPTRATLSTTGATVGKKPVDPVAAPVPVVVVKKPPVAKKATVSNTSRSTITKTATVVPPVVKKPARRSGGVTKMVMKLPIVNGKRENSLSTLEDDTRQDIMCGILRMLLARGYRVDKTEADIRASLADDENDADMFKPFPYTADQEPPPTPIDFRRQLNWDVKSADGSVTIEVHLLSSLGMPTLNNIKVPPHTQIILVVDNTYPYCTKDQRERRKKLKLFQSSGTDNDLASIIPGSSDAGKAIRALHPRKDPILEAKERMTLATSTAAAAGYIDLQSTSRFTFNYQRQHYNIMVHQCPLWSDGIEELKTEFDDNLNRYPTILMEDARVNYDYGSHPPDMIQFNRLSVAAGITRYFRRVRL